MMDYKPKMLEKPYKNFNQLLLLVFLERYT